MTVPTDAQVYSREDPTKPDIAFLKNHFYREGRITEEQALYILDKGTDLLRAESNLLEVDAPITGEFLPHYNIPSPPHTILTRRYAAPTVCGDIHGQYVCGFMIDARMRYFADTQS